MKKWLVFPILVLLLASLFLYWQFNYPSDETIRREFLEQHPNVEFVSTEMIFDWEPKRMATYSVRYKEPPSNEILLDEFTIKQHWDFRWRWCNSQTERKCK
ncbi:MAG: hypothetical protein H0W58_01185 [Acidobacteria bacterium]|nr:hypothetical protein [Acidobacteriota bacterium]